jgi:hypothetical protein
MMKKDGYGIKFLCNFFLIQSHFFMLNQVLKIKTQPEIGKAYQKSSLDGFFPFGAGGRKRAVLLIHRVVHVGY